MLSYEQISDKYKIKKSILTRRVHVLKIKPYFEGRTVVFNSRQIKQIIEYKRPERKNKKNHKEKLRIIEFYFKLRSARKTAIFLNIGRELVDAAVKEYIQTGTITVESSLGEI